MNSDRQLHKIEIVSTKKKKCLHNSYLHNLPLLMDGINLMGVIWCNVFVSQDV